MPTKPAVLYTTERKHLWEQVNKLNIAIIAPHLRVIIDNKGPTELVLHFRLYTVKNSHNILIIPAKREFGKWSSGWGRECR